MPELYQDSRLVLEALQRAQVAAHLNILESARATGTQPVDGKCVCVLYFPASFYEEGLRADLLLVEIHAGPLGFPVQYYVDVVPLLCEALLNHRFHIQLHVVEKAQTEKKNVAIWRLFVP